MTVDLAPATPDQTPITADLPWTKDTPASEVFDVLGIHFDGYPGSSPEHVTMLAEALRKVAVGSAARAREQAVAIAAAASFRDAVRTKAREVADEQDWCRPGLNDTLRELGLDEYPAAWNVTVEMTVCLTVEESGDAWDDDSAADRARYAIDDVELSGDDDVRVDGFEITCCSAVPSI
ncbi:MAG TPA: hypothetical protein VHW93_09230 [Acidimicrobiales bacterium]|jgi:hypothetical protein|nr:hypothetical protein [Acidimicrobiales bacterium]